MLQSQDKRRRISSQDTPNEDVSISIPNHALLQRFAVPLTSSARSTSDVRKEDKPHKAVGELPHILELKQATAVPIDVKKEEVGVEGPLVSVGDVGNSSAAVVATTTSSDRSSGGVVNVVQQTTEKQPSVDPPTLGISSTGISFIQLEEAPTSKTAIIPEDIKMLVDTLELSYAVDETDKLIGLIRTKATNIPELGGAKKQIDLLLKLLQVKRNIDESITQLLEL